MIPQQFKQHFASKTASKIVDDTIRSLFRNNEQGWWYDPSDMSTLFQDHTGTPVTAMEQPVGLMLDKRLGMTLGAELVTDGDFSSDASWSAPAGWVITNGSATHTPGNTGYVSQVFASAFGAKILKIVIEVTVTAGSAIVQPGGYEYFSITQSGTYTKTMRINSAGDIGMYIIPSSDFDGSISFISVKEVLGNHAYQATAINRPTLSARVNQAVSSENLAGAGWVRGVGPTVTATTVLNAEGSALYQTISGWHAGISGRVAVEARRSASGSATHIRLTTNNSTDWNTGISQKFLLTEDWTLYTMSGVLSTGSFVTLHVGGHEGVSGGFDTDCAGNTDIRYVDIRPTNQAHLPYQRVNTATDYDSVGFPKYLVCNGTNNAMQTAAINLTGSDKLTSIFAGRLLSVAAYAMLMELSADAGLNAGAFYKFFNLPTTSYEFARKGTSSAQQTASTTIEATVSHVISYGIDFDATTEVTTQRLNGAAAGSAGASDSGAGPFGNYPLYLFARNNGANFHFNGHFYGAVGSARSTGVSTPELIALERIVAKQTGVVL